jgi:hypothetical protein
LLKETDARLSPVVKSLTGMDTSPNEMVAVESARAGMSGLSESPQGRQRHGRAIGGPGRRLNGVRNDRSLAKYRRMRRAGATPEPMSAGGARRESSCSSTARATCTTTCLEWRGALLSWAVLKVHHRPDEAVAVQVEIPSTTARSRA